MKKFIALLLALPFIGFAQNTYVPDDAFEQALINLGYDNVLDDYVSTASIDTVTYLQLDSFFTGNSIFSLVGIEGFTSLTELHCSYNQLDSLDLSSNLNLEAVSCASNLLTYVNLTNNIALTSFGCEDNLLTTLDLTNNTNLVFLACPFNSITSIDLSNNILLTHLFLLSNQLTSLDLSSNVLLEDLNCSGNPITEIDLSNNTDLYSLDFGITLISTLDLSNNTLLLSVNLQNNDSLKTLNIKNGINSNYSSFYTYSCNALECVNVDDVSIATNSTVLNTILVNPNAYFSEDCSVGRVEGLVYYDSDSSTTFNAGDNPLSNQVLELISASGGVQYLTTSNSGQFSSAVDSLTAYTLSYYPPGNLTETSNTVSYSFNNIATDSVLNGLNFGVKGDGDYVDLGIYLTKSFTLCNDTALLTIDVVNHASTTVDGSFEFWLDSQTPVLAASGSPTITANHLLWNFTALQPFQNLQQSISYVVPANPGTILFDSALVTPTLSSGAFEINTFNNTAENQDIVFCSWDPNDKKIIPEQCYYAADDIMQHTIRFQNTGNYPAQKVRIVDTLDYAVLDVLSFQIIGASHAYTWEFKGSSILEITFDNIQLVDSSVSYVESQGFFKYQIKFKDNITALSESEMSAYIYFDNNQPVITNKPLAVYSENFNAIITQSPYNLTVQITDGTLPFTYLWNTNEITQDINIQSSGNYWVIVTDANGCELDTLMYNVTGVGLDEINNERTLVRVIDLLGREIDITKNLPYASFFFIYDDGSVEKHIIIE